MRQNFVDNQLKKKRSKQRNCRNDQNGKRYLHKDTLMPQKLGEKPCQSKGLVLIAYAITPFEQQHPFGKHIMECGLIHEAQRRIRRPVSLRIGEQRLDTYFSVILLLHIAQDGVLPVLSLRQQRKNVTIGKRRLPGKGTYPSSHPLVARHFQKALQRKAVAAQRVLVRQLLLRHSQAMMPPDETKTTQADGRRAAYVPPCRCRRGFVRKKGDPRPLPAREKLTGLDRYVSSRPRIKKRQRPFCLRGGKAGNVYP